MDNNYSTELAKVRIERAEELLAEAQTLLDGGSYKSANNRAYYAIEKSMNALLAAKGVETSTHSGCLKQFNFHYIHQGDGSFTPEDYRIVSAAEQVRTVSDYDDFYLASKDETEEQVQNAEYFVNKVKKYLDL